MASEALLDKKEKEGPPRSVENKKKAKKAKSDAPRHFTEIWILPTSTDTSVLSHAKAGSVEEETECAEALDYEVSTILAP